MSHSPTAQAGQGPDRAGARCRRRDRRGLKPLPGGASSTRPSDSWPRIRRSGRRRPAVVAGDDFPVGAADAERQRRTSTAPSLGRGGATSSRRAEFSVFGSTVNARMRERPHDAHPLNTHGHFGPRFQPAASCARRKARFFGSPMTQNDQQAVFDFLGAPPPMTARRSSASTPTRRRYSWRRTAPSRSSARCAFRCWIIRHCPSAKPLAKPRSRSTAPSHRQSIAA